MLSFSVANSVRDSRKPQTPLGLLRAVALHVVPDQQRQTVPGLGTERQVFGPHLWFQQLRMGATAAGEGPTQSQRAGEPPGAGVRWGSSPGGRRGRGRSLGEPRAGRARPGVFRIEPQFSSAHTGCRGRPSREECSVHEEGGVRVLPGLTCSN